MIGVRFKSGITIYVARRTNVTPFIRIIEQWLDTHGYPPPYDQDSYGGA